MTQQSILLIDNSPDMLVLQKAILESDGFRVFTAKSGKEGLEALSKIEEPNLILLDMQMDDMNGTEFLTLLEEKKPEILEHVPVVLLSGIDEPPKSRAVGFIRKFPDIDVFLQIVRQYIDDGPSH